MRPLLEKYFVLRPLYEYFFFVLYVRLRVIYVRRVRLYRRTGIVIEVKGHASYRAYIYARIAVALLELLRATARFCLSL